MNNSAHRQAPAPVRIAVAAVAGLTLLTTAGAISAATSRADGADYTQATVAGGWVSAKAVARDRDGDGWSDWAELEQGTDPDDPASYPTGTSTS